MSESLEQLISKYVQGNLSAEEQQLFDRKFEADPGFSEKVLQAMGQRLGPGPESFLDRMAQAAKPAVEEAWRRKAVTVARQTATSGVSQVWSVLLPVVVLLAALLGLVCAARFMISSEQDRQASLWKASSEVPVLKASKEPSFSQEVEKPVREDTVQPPKSGPAGHDEVRVSKMKEGRSVRFQNLPASPKTTIEILDNKDGFVKRLYQGPWASGQQLDWDGLDREGKPVKPGTYRARVKNTKGTFISQFIVK